MCENNYIKKNKNKKKQKKNKKQKTKTKKTVKEKEKEKRKKERKRTLLLLAAEVVLVEDPPEVPRPLLVTIGLLRKARKARGEGREGREGEEGGEKCKRKEGCTGSRRRGRWRDSAIVVELHVGKKCSAAGALEYESLA
jgi:hypothetical protein